MRLYLFVIDGKPMVRIDLHLAQAALEDHLRERRDVSDVWWDDKYPYEARTYLYEGSSHLKYISIPEGEDEETCFETTDQLIWPVDLAGIPSAPIDILDPAGARLSLSVTTRQGKSEFDRVIPEQEWADNRMGTALLISKFALDAAYGLGDVLNPKEGS